MASRRGQLEAGVTGVTGPLPLVSAWKGSLLLFSRTPEFGERKLAYVAFLWKKWRRYIKSTHRRVTMPPVCWFVAIINHWIITANWPCRSIQIDRWPGGLKSYLWQPLIASQVIQQTDGRATDSCFGLIGPRQCGVLMVIAGWLVASVSTPNRTLVVSTEAGGG